MSTTQLPSVKSRIVKEEDKIINVNGKLFIRYDAAEMFVMKVMSNMFMINLNDEDKDDHAQKEVITIDE